jgi:hypothetical protein
VGAMLGQSIVWNGALSIFMTALRLPSRGRRSAISCDERE